MFRISKKNKVVVTVIAIFFLCAAAGGIFFYSYYNKIISNQDNKQILNNKILFLTEENSNLKSQISDLQNSLVSLKNKFISLENNLSLIETRIAEFENLNPVTSEKNVLIVVLAYKIKELYYDNKNFNAELDNLKNITKNKNNIYLNVVKLDQFINSENVCDIFNNEYKKLLTVNGSNKIEKFINQNIQVRKIKNIDDSDDVINKHIKQIEDFIKKHDYEKALDIVTGNRYDNVLSKTKKALTKNIEFNIILDNILNDVYINY